MLKFNTVNKRTLPEILNSSYKKFADRPALNFVGSTESSYGDFYEKVNALSVYLKKSGISKNDKVAIFSANMPNWAIVQFAVTMIGAVYVPILPGFSQEEIKNILTHSEVKTIFVSDMLYKHIADIKTPFLSERILINNMAKIPEDFPYQNLKELKNDICLEACHHIPFAEIEEEDTASIIYTSGTTGFSKGVELSHRNLVWNALQCRTIYDVKPEDRFLSILPMAHTYENTLGLLLPLICGSSIYYLDKAPSPGVLIPAMKKIRPTAMLSVPMVIEKIYKSTIVPKINANKVTKFLHGYNFTRKFIHKMAGKKLIQSFGGAISFFGIGGAKLDSEVERFLKEARFPYAVGYGLTETAPMVAGSSPAETYLNTIGPLMKGVDVKIHAPKKSGEGEIWIKSPSVMKGYYKQPELTKEVITRDGWFKTGDLGCFDKKGRLQIKGRKKTMILGASGENIYPEEIESIINTFRFVSESLVMEYKGKLVAMVYFNIEELEKHLTNFKNQASSYIEDLKKELREYVNSKVNNFSKLQMVVEKSEPFEKTPTHKIKRFLYNNNPYLIVKK